MKKTLLTLTALCTLAIGFSWSGIASADLDPEACQKKCHAEEQECVSHCHDDRMQTQMRGSREKVRLALPLTFTLPLSQADLSRTPRRVGLMQFKSTGSINRRSRRYGSSRPRA